MGRDPREIEYDLAIYGTAFTLDGKRVDPSKVTIDPYEDDSPDVAKPGDW